MDAGPNDGSPSIGSDAPNAPVSHSSNTPQDASGSETSDSSGTSDPDPKDPRSRSASVDGNSTEGGDSKENAAKPAKKKRRRKRKRKTKKDRQVEAAPARASTEDEDPVPDFESRAGGDHAALRRRAHELQRELAQLFFDRFGERQRVTGLDGRQRPTTLNVQLRLSPDEELDLDELDRQVRQSAYELADRCAAFPAGHVYCYWCGTFRCEHSIPSGPKTVFTGYSETGQPQWNDFGSVLLDRADPRIDILYRDNGNPLTLTIGGGELASRQLQTYGKRSPIYRIIGQVSIGYLSIPRRSELGSFAVSFQAVEAAGGRSPAHLNVLGHLEDGTPAAEALEEWFDPRLLDAIDKTRRQLAEIASRKFSRKQQADKRRQVLDTLRLLAKNFDRIFRSSGRRTLHSRDRHRNKQRPTAVAFQDALQAKRDAIYRDVEEQTWVVRGPKNRIHIFNDSGRHITSIVYPGETVKQRTTKGKWLTVQPQEVDTFMQSVRSHRRTERSDEDATRDSA